MDKEVIKKRLIVQYVLHDPFMRSFEIVVKLTYLTHPLVVMGEVSTYSTVFLLGGEVA